MASQHTPDLPSTDTSTSMLARDHVRQSQWLRWKFGADVCAKPQPSRRQTAEDGLTRSRPKQFTYIVHI
jgi:hypothetical protein